MTVIITSQVGRSAVIRPPCGHAAAKFVVAWTTARESSGTALFAQRFAPDGIFLDGFE